MIICGLNSVNLIWLYLACVYRGRDDKIIRIVKIAGLHRTSSQWWWLRLCKVPKRLFCLARSWCEYRSSRQIWKKVIWAFVNLNSYSMLGAATKVLVIPNLLSTCKAPVIEKIRFKVTWWTLLLCVWVFLRDSAGCGCSFFRLCFSTELWMMNRNYLHFRHPIYLSKLAESIPSQAHQLICEMLEINFTPVLLTVIERIH